MGAVRPWTEGRLPSHLSLRPAGVSCSMLSLELPACDLGVFSLPGKRVSFGDGLPALRCPGSVSKRPSVSTGCGSEVDP